MSTTGVPPTCSYYLRNSCTNGTACRFNHPITIPESITSRSRTVCSHFLRGSCRYGDACQRSHEDVGAEGGAFATNSKELHSCMNTTTPKTSAMGFGVPTPASEVCRFFLQGKCVKGISCTFSHISAEPLPVETSKVQSPTKTGPLQQELVSGSRPAFKSPCIYFARGKCTNGTACSFSHTVNTQVVGNPPTSKGLALIPCKFFRRGSCLKGEECEFFHPSPDKPALPPPPSAVLAIGMGPNIIEDSPTTKNSVFIPKSQANPPDNNTVTVAERSIYKCAVTFGAGAAIQQIITPFESRHLILSNLPSDITQADVIRIVEPFGELAGVIIEEPTRPLKARVEYTKCHHAAQAVKNLKDMLFRSHRLSVRLDLRAVEDGSGSGTLISRKAKISWFAPSAIAWAHYGTLAAAKTQAIRLEGKSFDGRKLSVLLQTPTFRQTKSFSIEIKGLSPGTSQRDLGRFCNSSSVSIREPYSNRSTSIADVRDALEKYGHLEAFDVLPPDNSKSKITAFVQFSTSEEATTAVKKLHNIPQDFLSSGRIWLEQIHSIKYNIPNRQFATIKVELDRFQTTLGQECKLRYHDRDENGRPATFVAIRIYGADPKALGRAKAEVENLIHGELLSSEGKDVWDEYFDTSDGRLFLGTLATDFSFFVRSDSRTRTIRLFGTNLEREHAKAIITSQIEVSRMRRHNLPLKKDALRALLTGGLKKLHDEFGSEKVLLDVVSLTLTVRGSDDEVKRVSRLISIMSSSIAAPLVHATEDELCPVCFCDVASPVELPCRHSYCMACLQHLLRSAAAGSTFSSLRCVAETQGSDKTITCGLDIPYHIIRELLSSTEEAALLEASLLSHIHAHPEEFKYCPTPDCQVIYRPGQKGAVLQCPSCLVRMCGACHVEFHEGLTCREHLDNVSGGHEALQRWKDANGVKSCPKCKADIQKTGGCNHVACPVCQTHICWVCMKSFCDQDGGGGVYAHMRNEHGSIGG